MSSENKPATTSYKQTVTSTADYLVSFFKSRVRFCRINNYFFIIWCFIILLVFFCVFLLLTVQLSALKTLTPTTTAHCMHHSKKMSILSEQVFF